MDMKYKISFLLITLFCLALFFVSIYDIFSFQQRFRYLLFASISLFIISVILFFYMYRSSRKQMDPVILFKKMLHGGLYHFKCPLCKGIFALKESRENEIKNLLLTCPDCGTIGRISSNSPVMVEAIPFEKSHRVSFICRICGERLNLWAEGRPLFEEINIFSCPYCGNDEPMKPQ